jgi:hypothetical protein
MLSDESFEAYCVKQFSMPFNILRQNTSVIWLSVRIWKEFPPNVSYVYCRSAIFDFYFADYL